MAAMEWVIDVFIELFLRGTVLLLLALVVLLTMRRSSAASREFAGRCFLAALCVLPLFVLSGLSIDVLPVPSPPGAKDGISGLYVSSESVHLDDLESFATSVGNSSSNPIALSRWVLGFGALVWVLGSCCLLVFTVAGYLVSARRFSIRATTALPLGFQQRLGLGDGCHIWISSRATQPMVVGLCRPRIVLPSAFVAWSPATQQSVLRHELAHIARKDAIAVALWNVARILWWPHPATWSFGRRMSLLREQACDDFVVASGIEAGAYASALVEIARIVRVAHERPSSNPTLAMTSTTHLEVRIRALLRPDIRRLQPSRVRRWSIVSLTLLVGVACAVCDAVAQGAPSESPTAKTPSQSTSARKEGREPVVDQADTKAEQRNRAKADRTILIAVTDNGDVIHGGRKIGLVAVRPLVKKLLAAGAGPVVVKGASRTQASVLVRVIDEAKLAGAHDVVVSTRTLTDDFFRVFSPSMSDPIPRETITSLKDLLQQDPDLSKLLLAVAEDDPAARRIVQQLVKRHARDDRKQVLELLAQWMEKRIQAKRATLEASELLERLESTMKPAGEKRVAQSISLRGRVLDGDFDAPLPGVSVMIRDSKLRATTGKDGRFSFERLPAGRYELVFSKDRYASKSKVAHVDTAAKSAEVDVVLKAKFEDMEDHVVDPNERKR
ncbi:MAG: carboxypeptidase regulatory-like domain-containing protein [Planctomycetes bacterium]|nr:carboxypeptidase regulatory-like domain-containing protein [Planctomycetota bacterium]